MKHCVGAAIVDNKIIKMPAIAIIVNPVILSFFITLIQPIYQLHEGGLHGVLMLVLLEFVVGKPFQT